MIAQPVRPDFAGLGNVAGFGGIEAFEPCLILAPEEIAATRQKNSTIMENGHAIKIARAFAAIAIEVVNVCFRRGWIEIELPGLLQPLHFARRDFAAQRL